MCIEFLRQPTKRIAGKKGVICYKLMLRNSNDNSWNSLVQNYAYLDGKKNPPQRIRIQTRKADYTRDIFRFATVGYHSYCRLEDALNKETLGRRVVQCLIPPGTVYYIGQQYKIPNFVSSRIVITGNLKTGKRY